MLYCSNKRNLEGNIIRNIIPKNKRIFYDQEKDLFYNQYQQIISVKDRVVVPVSSEGNLEYFYSLLRSKGALFTNEITDVKKIEKWYEYIEPKRQIIPFTKNDLNNLVFLTYLIESFCDKKEAYVSNSSECVSVDISTLLQGFMPFMSSKEKECIISEKVDINEDEYGPIEYQVLIERGKLINLSRLVDTKEYVNIPREVFSFIFELLESIPEQFPKTYILRIVSTNNMYELIDIRPIEKTDTTSIFKNNTPIEYGPKLSKVSK